jgi:Kef-type K+ transport system membrane component KefB/nucleotide-binding universal stress UspA family protein
MNVFTAAPHHDVLALVLQIAVLLFSARMLGEFAQRLGQPSVVGEILAGIVLGPSILGRIFPVLTGLIIPETPVQGYLLETISMLGAIFLLLVTGLETDLQLVRRHARTALGVSAGGIFLTFSTGFLLGQMLPVFLIGEGQSRLIFSLFIATAMSISAIPVIAKVLIDLKLMRRDIGQTIIAAGITDDTVGWILLSIVVGLVGGTGISASNAFGSIGKVLGFMIFSFTVGRWLVKKALDFTQDELKSRDRLLTLVIVMTFAWSALTQALHIEPVLGAFVMGILFGQMPRLPHEVREKIESVAMGIFSPIFFAVAGLKVDLLRLFDPQLMLIAVCVIFVATFGKVAGTYFGARVIGRRDHWTALSFGAALNARGAMEIIIATIGLSLGILSRDMFSIIVIMAIATSLMAPAALKWVMQHIKPDEQEAARLNKEEMASGSPIAKIHRVLMPVRQRRFDQAHQAPAQIIKKNLLGKMSEQNKLSVTLFSVASVEQKKSDVYFDVDDFKTDKAKEVISKMAVNKDPVQAILEEAQKNYHLLILGGSEGRKNRDNLFSPVIDDLVRMSPCATLVIHANEFPQNWKPEKILIPTNGSMAAKRAAELAFLLASPESSQVLVLNVVVQSQDEWPTEFHGASHERQLEISRRLTDELKDLGQANKITTTSEIRVGHDPESEILDAAIKGKVDLMIIGTDVRPASERLFLGPKVEKILRNAPCPVIVLNTI